ncbi:pancreatic lipase-related protein 2 [Nasonia vitripennis]|uniref:phospholipase A1 n=1 Tax=Nasonia vitripennis TaxID=7425 RepID=A0A7M7LNH3_NASVI|nr:pancreatic lipase-related protein 2 [Nasonia vitripennis]
MKAVLLIFLVTLLYSAKDARSFQISCADLKSVVVIGQAFLAFSNSGTDDVPVRYYLSTAKHRQSVEIASFDWSGLETGEFDVSKKTFIVIHGFKSGGQKSWVLLLKDKIIDATQANVILIDWSEGSNKKNYVNAARNTQLATNRIFNFLQQMRIAVNRLNKTGEIQWNHLNFIGHSLGAQVSGQTAHLLKEDNFWKIDRITGLDPARPCFTNVDPSVRLDKDDADFVDIIHTQTGTGGSVDGLGLKESIGHMDFYINGGIEQPACVSKTLKWDNMICSHKLAYKYFTDGIIDALMGYPCPLQSYSWNGTYVHAQRILSDKLNGVSCTDCPHIGLDAFKSNKRGIFFVVTGNNEPYCQVGDDDLKNVITVIRKLKRHGLVTTSDSIDYHEDESDPLAALYNSAHALKFENLTLAYLFTVLVFIFRH